MNELVSLIVPVYKAEDYLDRCVESIVNQTYRDLEIILVDDGSPDGCPQKCDEWAERDGRVKVIHKENGGVSSARNAGLKAMTGKYVTFVDADDYVSGRYCQVLLETMLKTNADLVCCKNNRDIYPSDMEGSIIEIKKELPMAAWGFLYKTDILFFNDLVFHEEFFFGEDACFALQYLLLSKKYVKVYQKLYHYTCPTNSMVNSGWTPKKNSWIDACLFMREISKDDKILYNMCSVRLCTVAHICLREMYCNKRTIEKAVYKQSYKYNLSVLRKNLRYLLKSDRKILRKVQLVFVCMFPRFYLWIRSKYEKRKYKKT